jgi:TolA-binding protein
MKQIQLILLCFLAFAGCKEQINFSDTSLNEAYGTYAAAKNENTAKEFAGKVVEYLILNPGGSDRQIALEQGMEVSKSFNLASARSSFLTSLIKEFPRDEKTPKRVFELAELMNNLGKSQAKNALLYSFLEKYKSHDLAEKAREMISEDINDIDAYITKLGEEVFENPDEFGINRTTAQAYVDACEAYAMVNPESVATPDFLYKAAEIARTLRTFPKALSLYDWIINEYPEYEKSPTSLFLKAYVLENNLKDIERARETYNAFLAKYPTHHLADDVSFLLDNLGKSDDEILDLITKKQKEAQ